jgi:hypothetical protein
MHAGSVALAGRVKRQTEAMTSSRGSSVFAGFRFPPEVISVAVRWYLRYGRHCCIKRSHDHLTGKFLEDAVQGRAERAAVPACRDRSVRRAGEFTA